MATSKTDPNVSNAPAEGGEKLLAAVAPVPIVTGQEHCCIAHYWAVLETNGTLVRGHNVWRVAHLAPGIYEVIFNGDVSAGVFQATIGRPGIFTEPTGEICVALRFLPPPPNPEFNKGVWIQTFDSAGHPSDRAFHLLVLTAG